MRTPDLVQDKRDPVSPPRPPSGQADRLVLGWSQRQADVTWWLTATTDGAPAGQAARCAGERLKGRSSALRAARAASRQSEGIGGQPANLQQCLLHASAQNGGQVRFGQAGAT